ncbi:MAG: SDR family NAD(P)-dependent oxidoreductase [Myxococcales bacterium]|nr:SDR family NAD(P)-dependent oxidoreductase [Myxococcales bacterium]
MKDLESKVAVITGGAAGIGREIALRFGQEGMKLVLADVEATVLEATVKELNERSIDAIGVVTDVAKLESVEALRDATLDAYGAVHVVCNNAGVGGGGGGHAWEHEMNDWRWAFDVNVLGVVHGINAFVPVLVAQDVEAHVINTSSHNGGFFPLPSTAIYAATKASVVTITEVLWAQLREIDSKVGASVLFPSGRSPGILNTGIWNSGRNRPAEYAQQNPREEPAGSALEKYKKAMEAAGRPVVFADLSEIADQVVEGIRADQFWIHPPSDLHDASILERAESMVARGTPDYMLARLDPPRTPKQ